MDYLRFHAGIVISIKTKHRGFNPQANYSEHLCGLVVRVPGYRSRGPEFDSRGYQIFWEVVGLERGPLGLVRINEELPEWKSSGSGSRKSRSTAVAIHCADHVTPSVRKFGTNFAYNRRSLGRGLKPRSLILVYTMRQVQHGVLP
jgi:hypothetical protein